MTLPSRAGGQCHYDGQLGSPGNPTTGLSPPPEARHEAQSQMWLARVYRGVGADWHRSTRKMK
eukprot:6169254-Pyramimonas_sp.AAC.2